MPRGQLGGCQHVRPPAGAWANLAVDLGGQGQDELLNPTRRTAGQRSPPAGGPTATARTSPCNYAARPTARRSRGRRT
eukprot:7696127-Alexandrium_andersonii.AAC.1